MSNVSRGNYYLQKTRKFLENEGYKTEKLETLSGVFVKGKMIWHKKDMLFSDLLAYNEKEFLLIQVKGGNDKGLGINKALENYSKLGVPKFIKKVVVVWRPRIRQPEWHEVE